MRELGLDDQRVYVVEVVQTRHVVTNDAIHAVGLDEANLCWCKPVVPKHTVRTVFATSITQKHRLAEAQFSV
jgi:hypothetical protein